MTNSWQKTVCIVLVGTLCFTFLAYPAQAEAGFLRNLIKFLRKTTSFIVNLPGKIASELTRPLGPVLGPIVANVLLANTPNRIVEIVTKAEKIKSGVDIFADQQKKLNQAKKILEERAYEVYDDIAEMWEIKERLEKDLLSGDLPFSEYKDKVIAFTKVMEAYEDTAQRLDQAAQNLKPESLLKQVAADALHQGKRKIQRIVRTRVGQELEKLINLNVVKTFLEGGGLNVADVIDLVIAGDASRMMKELGYSKDHPDFKKLLDLIKEDIKEQLKNDKQFLKDNWRELINKKIKDILAEYELNKKEGSLEGFFLDYKKSNENSAAANANESADVKEDTSDLDALLDFEDPEERIAPDPALPKDKDGCYPGYHFERLSGVGCVQTNCGAVAHAHYSSTQQCVCGSSGSIAEDPKDYNKECYNRSDNAACPSCVYACVKLDADCPEPKK